MSTECDSAVSHASDGLLEVADSGPEVSNNAIGSATAYVFNTANTTGAGLGATRRAATEVAEITDTTSRINSKMADRITTSVNRAPYGLKRSFGSKTNSRKMFEGSIPGSSSRGGRDGATTIDTHIARDFIYRADQCGSNWDLFKRMNEEMCKTLLGMGYYVLRDYYNGLIKPMDAILTLPPKNKDKISKVFEELDSGNDADTDYENLELEALSTSSSIKRRGEDLINQRHFKRRMKNFDLDSSDCTDSRIPPPSQRKRHRHGRKKLQSQNGDTWRIEEACNLMTAYYQKMPQYPVLRPLEALQDKIKELELRSGTSLRLTYLLSRTQLPVLYDDFYFLFLNCAAATVDENFAYQILGKMETILKYDTRPKVCISVASFRMKLLVKYTTVESLVSYTDLLLPRIEAAISDYYKVFPFELNPNTSRDRYLLMRDDDDIVELQHRFLTSLLELADLMSKNWIFGVSAPPLFQDVWKNIVSDIQKDYLNLPFPPAMILDSEMHSEFVFNEFRITIEGISFKKGKFSTRMQGIVNEMIFNIGVSGWMLSELQKFSIIGDREYFSYYRSTVLQERLRYQSGLRFDQYFEKTGLSHYSSPAEMMQLIASGLTPEAAVDAMAFSAAKDYPLFMLEFYLVHAEKAIEYYMKYYNFIKLDEMTHLARILRGAVSIATNMQNEHLAYQSQLNASMSEATGELANLALAPIMRAPSFYAWMSSSNGSSSSVNSLYADVPQQPEQVICRLGTPLAMLGIAERSDNHNKDGNLYNSSYGDRKRNHAKNSNEDKKIIDGHFQDANDNNARKKFGDYGDAGSENHEGDADEANMSSGTSSACRDSPE